MPCDERVRFKSADDSQVQWGGGSDPRKFFRVGDVLTLVDSEVRSWHTRYYFAEAPGKWFNSACFEAAENSRVTS